METKIFLQKHQKSSQQQDGSSRRSQWMSNVFMYIWSGRMKVSHLWSKPKESKTYSLMGHKPFRLIRSLEIVVKFLNLTAALLHLRNMYPTSAVSFYFWLWIFSSPWQTILYNEFSSNCWNFKGNLNGTLCARFSLEKELLLGLK